MQRKERDMEFHKGREKVWVDQDLNSFNVYVYNQPELVSALLEKYDKVSPIAVNANTRNSLLGKETVVTIRMDVIKKVESPRTHAFQALSHANQAVMKEKWGAAKVEMMGEISSVIKSFGFTKKERSAGHGM